jgi:hypothetical protein
MLGTADNIAVVLLHGWGPNERLAFEDEFEFFGRAGLCVEEVTVKGQAGVLQCSADGVDEVCGDEL